MEDRLPTLIENAPYTYLAKADYGLLTNIVMK